jgi:Tol biopolymer transport system component
VYSSDPSGLTEIRYFDFATNTDHLVPTGGVAAVLADVSNGHIVYTELGGLGSLIGEYDVATATTTYLGTSANNKASNPTVAADGSAAYQSRSFSANPSETEIVVTDLTQPDGAANVTRLTNDAMMDLNPQISADGNHVAYQKGFTTGTGMDIWVADKTSPGVWTETQLTGAAGEDVKPDISGDGRFVTWSATVAGATDVYVLDRDDNTTYQFAIASDQRNPSITEDGKYISFESHMPDPVTGGNYEIILANNPLHDDFIV